MPASHDTTTAYLYWYPIAALLALVAISLLWRGRIAARLAWLVAGIGIALFIAETLWHYPQCIDFNNYRSAGQAVMDARDPYRDVFMNYPPTAIPLFRVFALLPAGVAQVIWVLLNGIGLFLLVGACHAALRRVGPPNQPKLTLPELALLSTAVALSIPSHFTMQLGQASLFASVMILAAVYFRAAGRWIMPGVCMALAAVKPHTALPFMLLFCTKKDRLTWIVVAVLMLAFIALSGPPDQLGVRLHELQHNVTFLMKEGNVNDFSDANIHAHTLVGFDRLVYCLGVHDRQTVRAAYFALIAAVGLWVAWQRLRPPRMPAGAAASLVALFSMLFLYHRTTDLTMLALPLVYCAAHAIHGHPAVRPLHRAVAIMILALLYVHPRVVESAVRKLHAIPAAESIATAILQPHATWVILISMFLLWRATRKSAMPGAAR